MKKWCIALLFCFICAIGCLTWIALDSLGFISHDYAIGAVLLGFGEIGFGFMSVLLAIGE